MTESLQSAALYVTVWIALACFVTGEAGKLRARKSGVLLGWAWMVWTAGAALLAMHIAVALHVRHGWSHASTMRAVEEQARAVYGVGWGGGVWFNYLFLLAWMAEAIWWRAVPSDYLHRRLEVTMLLRAFYALILINGAIVFAAPARRPAGVIAVAVVLWVWRDTFHSTERSPAPPLDADTVRR